MSTVSDRWGVTVVITDRSAPTPGLVQMPFEGSTKEEALQVLGKTMADELFRLTGSRGGQGF